MVFDPSPRPSVSAMQEKLSNLDQLVSEPSARTPIPIATTPSHEELLTQIASIPLFAELLPVHLERIMAIGQCLNFSAGQMIATKGESVDGVHLIVRGRVSKTFQNSPAEIERQNLPSGSCFGELAWADSDLKRPYDVYCEEACEVLFVPQASLRDLMFVDREFAHELLWRLLRRTMRRLANYEIDMTPHSAP